MLENRSMDNISEMWDDEALDGIVWEETKDNAGTGAFAVDDGRMYWNLDTDSGADDDAFVNSKFRFQVMPSTFSDSNCMIKKLILEFALRQTGTLANITNAGFLLGFTETKANLNTQNNIAAFTLDGSDNLIARTDNDGSDQNSSTISATLTNWNRFKIEVFSAGYNFFLNGVHQVTHTTQVPDEAMYVIFGIRSDGVGAVGLDIGNILCYYEPNI